MNNPFDVAGKVVVITGVTGQLGSIYAEALLSRGARVFGIDLVARDSCDSFTKRYGDNFAYFHADITCKTAIKDALAVCLDRFSNVHCLINNAAIDSPPSSNAAENGPFETYPEASWDKVIGVNLKGVFFVAR